MKLLKRNIKKNASNDSTAKKLVWDKKKNPLRDVLELDTPPDFILATDVVYGNDAEKWTALVNTMKNIAGKNTLILIGNVRRYPVKHPLSENKFYTESTKDSFYRAEVPLSSFHPDFRKSGAGACVIHALRLKDEENVDKKKTKKEKKKKDKKRKRYDDDNKV